jgi:hypothetical protein
MTNATKIIHNALDSLGLRGTGQRVEGAVLTHCLARLNTMLEAMNLGPTFAYTQTTTVVPVTSASMSLSIGPGQDIDIARPDRIEGSSFVRVGTVDYPLTPVDRDTYNSIQLKTLGSAWPSVCFWDGGNPLGNVFLWPQGTAVVHLVTSTAVGHFADLTTEYALPNGYERMFSFSLAEEVAPDFQAEVPASVTRIAQASRRIVKRNNLTVPQMNIPRTLDQDNGRYASAEIIAGLWI